MNTIELMSRLSWARGLKPVATIKALLKKVAPLVGAWIETYQRHQELRTPRRASRGRVD